MRTIFVRSLLIGGLCASSSVYAWGYRGHATVNDVAIAMVANPTAKKFLQANQQQIVRFANIPDTRWKSGPNAQLEKPLHWFEMDGYSTSRLGEQLPGLVFGKALEELGRDYVYKYGAAMWRIADFHSKLIEAVRAEDFTRAVQIAGVMGHYVGDIAQPMHASTDYDGQSINKPGIHKYYETTLVDRIDATQLKDAVVRVAGERRTGFERSIGNNLKVTELQRLAWNTADISFTALGPVLKRFDQETPNDKWLMEDLKPRIAYASALLGKIWDSAFAMAGTAKLPATNMNAKDPEWIPLGK